jgi:hypothetical protein
VHTYIYLLSLANSLASQDSVAAQYVCLLVAFLVMSIDNPTGPDRSRDVIPHSKFSPISTIQPLATRPLPKRIIANFKLHGSSTQQDRSHKNEEVFEDTDEEEDQSESTIEDDDADEEWEDDNEPGSLSNLKSHELFQRVDSKRNLVSQQSMLTSLIHEKDRSAHLLQDTNSHSSSVIRRSRKTSFVSFPGTFPPKSIVKGLAQPSHARPVTTTSNTHPPAALSPRTTRRNMLSTELTESLRKHLLWQRQVPRGTTNAALKRRHTAHDMKDLQHYPGDNDKHPITCLDPNLAPGKGSSWNMYFGSGLQEYHERGW